MITTGTKQYTYFFDRLYEDLCTEKICNCESCAAPCCKQFEVPLTPNEIKTLEYDKKAWSNNVAYLAKKDDGSCWYLSTENKCTIWNNRPITCREYSCDGDNRVRK